MSSHTEITVVGNLVDDPQLRFTQSGVAVANVRVASTPRYRDSATGEWKDGEALFLTATLWRQAAENIAESLQRGMRVIVTGRLKQRQYTNSDGQDRTVYEIDAEEIGPSLRFATARVTKATRTTNGASNGTATATGNGASPDPWAAPATDAGVPGFTDASTSAGDDTPPY